jgi:hypothetical protein
MTQYQHRVEARKEIVRATLANLAIELSDPRVADLDFTTTNLGFDYDPVSLIDRHGNIVAIVDKCDLADCPADASIRGKIEGRLRSAVEVSFRPKK